MAGPKTEEELNPIKVEPKVPEEGQGTPNKPEEKEKTGLLERALNNPAVVGTLTTAIVSALVTAGLDPEAAKTWGDYIMYGLILLFVGSASGVAVRSQVKPLRKK